MKRGDEAVGMLAFLEVRSSAYWKVFGTDNIMVTV